MAACPPSFSAAVVFGLNVCAARGVSKAALGHATGVLKRNLDFNDDGTPDNAKVAAVLAQQGATFVVVRRERQVDQFVEASGNKSLTVVFEGEMVKRGTRFDPTIEESLHLVTQFGYALAYPSIFGEVRGSAIAHLHDKAKARGYFDYDDPTCDYACMITEFTYWAITSLRDQQAGPGRFRDIGHEWSLNTPQKLAKHLPELDALLRTPAYKLMP